MLLGILGFVISIPYSLSLVPRYKAETSLLIEKAPISAAQTALGAFGALGVMAGLPNLPRAQEAETIAIFHSRIFTEKIISELGVLPILFEEAWDPDKMDILILLQPLEKMSLTHGVGDYDLDQDGRAIRSPDQKGSYMFTSMRINAPHIFNDAPDGAFSYLQLLDQAQTRGRLYGLVHDGNWHHISTPDDVKRVNDALKAHKDAGDP